ncbi:MAG: EAL domain-containing protein [Hyphomicrobium sp.]
MPRSIARALESGPARAASRSASSRRLARSVRAQDIAGERTIALAQAAIASVALALHWLGGPGDALSLGDWAPVALTALIASSALRWSLTGRNRLPEAWLDVLNVIDIGIVLSLVWGHHATPGDGSLGIVRPPVFILLVLVVVVRSLRFHPRPILVTGVTAVVGWSLLVYGSALATVAPAGGAIAAVHSIRMVEVARLIALGAIVLFLALGTLRARRLLQRAAHVSDYGEALDAARRHLDTATRAREQAESALRTLDRREAQLIEQNRLFDVALSRMTQGLCMFDKNQRLLVCNQRYLEMYDLPRFLAEPGTPFKRILESRIANGLYAGDDPEAYLSERLASVRDVQSNTKLHELRDGRIVAITHEPMEGGGWLATHDDVTRLRRIEAKLSHMARHDALTDLPNRVALRERLRQLLTGETLDGRQVILLLIEIDRFKEINDTLGPSIGDALLQHIAQRLRRRIDGADMIARIGGDEFVVLQVADEPVTVADVLVKSVRSVLGTSFDLDGQSVSISVSAGIAIGPADGVDPDDLLKSADLALGRAKDDGLGHARFFEREMDERMRARHMLEHDMRVGLGEGQFELHYQPQLNLARGEIVGFEALLRWKHPLRGLVPPSEFVPLAEETGFIVALGDWTLRQACAEAAKWPKGLRIAVNLSIAQFRSGQVRQSVIAALGASSLSPTRLDLEITESVLMEASEDVAEVLGRLQDIGVGIALDDFGTGFSSLSYLTRMRFDKIKIDKHFVHELRDEPNSALAVLRSIVALGQSLGIKTIAEGVETRQQLQRVRQEGCSEAQGFYVGRPLPAADIPHVLAGPGWQPARASLRAP